MELLQHHPSESGQGGEHENNATVCDSTRIIPMRQPEGDDSSENAAPHGFFQARDDVLVANERRNDGGSSSDDGDDDSCSSSDSGIDASSSSASDDDDGDSIDIGIFDEGWLRADEAFIADVHQSSAEIERELEARGLDSPFRDVSEILPKFDTFHRQMGGYAVRHGAGPLHSSWMKLPGKEERENSTSISSCGVLAVRSFLSLDMAFVANHLYCSEKSHVRPAGLVAARSLSLGADAVEGALLMELRRDPLKRLHRARGDGGTGEEVDGGGNGKCGRGTNDGDVDSLSQYRRTDDGKKTGADVVDAKGWRRIHRKLDREGRRGGQKTAKRERRRLKQRGGSDGTKAGSRLLGIFARKGSPASVDVTVSPSRRTCDDDSSESDC